MRFDFRFVWYECCSVLRCFKREKLLLENMLEIYLLTFC